MLTTAGDEIFFLFMHVLHQPPNQCMHHFGTAVPKFVAKVYSLTEIGTYYLFHNLSLGTRVNFFPLNLGFCHPATSCNVVCIVPNKRLVHFLTCIDMQPLRRNYGAHHTWCLCAHPNIAIVRVSSCYFRVERYRALQISTTSGVCFLNGFTIHRWPIYAGWFFVSSYIAIFYILLITTHIAVILVGVFLRSANNPLVISL